MADRDPRYQFIKQVAERGIGGRDEFWYSLVYDTKEKKYMIEVERDFLPHRGPAENSYSYYDMDSGVSGSEEARRIVDEIKNKASRPDAE
jgi:hypothetical protein